MSNRGLELQDRDYQVLSALEKWGVLGLGQLYGIAVEAGADLRSRVARYFNETDRRRDYGLWFARRLTALAEAGFIKDNRYVDHPKAYTLAERGHEVLKGRGLAMLQGFRGSISGELVRHELLVAAVGLLLTEAFHFRVRTERERYVWPSNGGRRPAPVRAVSDLWIVDFRPRAVEVELSQKSETRYKEIWEAYRLRLPHNAAVLYLAGWPNGVSCLLNHARRLGVSFVYAAAMQEFRASCGMVPFYGVRDEDSIVLEQPRTVPDAVESHRRVPPPSLPARPGFAGPGGRLGIGPFAAPPRPVGIGALTAPQERRGQSVPPPASHAGPRPHPLYLLPRAPEGDREQETGGVER